VIYHCHVVCSGATVVVNVTLEREDEIAGPILAPFFPQVTAPVLHCAICIKFISVRNSAVTDKLCNSDDVLFTVVNSVEQCFPTGVPHNQRVP